MAFTTLQSVRNALPGQEISLSPAVPATQPSTNPLQAYSSLWYQWGSSVRSPYVNAPAMSIPPASPGENPTSATSGALVFHNPSTTQSMRLGGLRSWAAQNGDGMVVLYDRLFHCGGLAFNVTTAQNVDPTPTNPVGRGYGTNSLAGNIGDDVEIWVEVYTKATTWANTTVTASYTNQAGTAGQTTPSINIFQNNAPSIGWAQRLPLASGDTGVRSVQTLTLGTASTGAGNFGVTLVRRLGEVMIQHFGYRPVDMDCFDVRFPLVPDNACLALATIQGTTAAINAVSGKVQLIEG